MFTALFLLVVLARLLEVNGQGALFMTIVGEDSTWVPQCGEIQFQFGGGSPPYYFGIREYDTGDYLSTMTYTEPGSVTWSVQDSTNSLLYLHMQDGVGTDVVSRYYQVEPSATNVNCYQSVPMLRRADQSPPFQMYSSPTPSQARANARLSSSLLKRTDPPTPDQMLIDCASGGPARCSFTASGVEGGISPQTAPLGSVVQNCDGGNETIKQSVTRSVTITDNWSVTSGVTLGPPMGVTRVSVSTTVSHSQDMTIEQTLEVNVPPGKKVVFVAYVDFKEIPGTMYLDYGHASSQNLDVNATYYQNTGSPAVTDAIVRDCDEDLPPLNATIAGPEISAAVQCGPLRLQGLGASVLVALVLLLC
ncbi:hypothetical protein FRC10_011403 [Ceratobasidium sp. 414]|nr:hypothetical protein FRC10_011403 [Ceratobasidium sp. 414]